MKITVVGVGNAGTTVAADLSLKGHEVTLLKTSNKLHNEHFQKLLETNTITVNENGTKRVAHVNATTDFENAICSAQLIIIYIQTNYHKELVEKISPYIKDGQTVLIEPGYLSTCFFLEKCKKDITVVEAESSPIDCRITAPCDVSVLFRNVVNPVGVYPTEKKEQAAEVLKELDYNFEILNSVVEAALHNPNLIVHTVGAIFSVPRIEYVSAHGGDYSMYREVFTPHVWKLVEALDSEKISVLKKLGCPEVSYVEACKHRNSADDTRDALEVFFDYANNSSPLGPDVPDSRYVTEDVPQGLVLLESLGNVLSVPTPTCTGLINCACAMLGRDFRLEGRTVEALGYDNIKRILENN